MDSATHRILNLFAERKGKSRQDMLLVRSDGSRTTYNVLRLYTRMRDVRSKVSRRPIKPTDTVSREANSRN